MSAGFGACGLAHAISPHLGSARTARAVRRRKQCPGGDQQPGRKHQVRRSVAGLTRRLSATVVLWGRGGWVAIVTRDVTG
jgi:hypothetical protein